MKRWGKCGEETIPTTAGEQVTTGAEEIARTKHVLLLQDGQVLFWEETLAEALAARPQ